MDNEPTNRPSLDYRAAIYFAVATMHFYRDAIQPLSSGQTLGDFATANEPVIKCVRDEAMRYIHYELSHEQIGRAIRAYLAPSVPLPTT